MAVRAAPVDEDIPLLPRDEDLIEEDGEPLESDWHRLAMSLLIDVGTSHLEGRDDFFVGSNMFIYFDEESVKKRRFRGPDFFLVWGVPLNPPRKYWATWKERGRFPSLIIELVSPRTVKTDRTTKKSIYEKIFQTDEYFIHDAADHSLEGWRLKKEPKKTGQYKPIVANEHVWMWCEQLGLWLGDWQGKFLRKEAVYPRFYDSDGELILTLAEAEKWRADALQAELDLLRSERKKNGRHKRK